MPPYFVDSAFWLALVRPRDPYYARALRWQKYLDAQRIPLVSTDLIWWEFLNAMSAPAVRATAAMSYRLARREPRLEILEPDRASLDEAFDLFAARPDKGWSLTDCHSFEVMRRRGLAEALTTDHHFEQAGFVALLRAEPPTT